MTILEERLLELKIELEYLVCTKEMMLLANAVSLDKPKMYREDEFKVLVKRFASLQAKLVALLVKAGR